MKIQVEDLAREQLIDIYQKKGIQFMYSILLIVSKILFEF